MSLNELERFSLAAIRGGPASALPMGEGTSAAWIKFGLGVLLESGRRLREARLAAFQGVDFKSDGSPVTDLEAAIERQIAASLQGFSPEAVVVGEETGGTLPGTGLAIAIDPLDGTWAFLSRTENITTTLAAFRDGSPFLGMVLNPATGEIGYALEDGPTRLLQLSIFGEDDSAHALPIPRADTDSVLVNLHPGRAAGPVVAKLYESWVGGDVRMVRSPGGSPAGALLEAAKGSFVYVNLWSKRPAEAYDLAAGCLLVRGAGGDVTGLDGLPIDPVSHAGPFVAAVDEESRSMVANLVRSVTDGENHS